MSIYTPPALNAVNFEITSFTPADLTPAGQALSAYTPPALSAVDFAVTVYTRPTYPYVGWELLPATGAVTATLSATLTDATLSSAATVTPAGAAITATLSATLGDATLASTATVTPAAAAITATLAATLQDATLSATATVPAVPVPITTTGGGGSNKTWRRKAKEAEALRQAILKALAQPDPVVVPVVVEAAEAVAVPERVREAPNWDLPRPQDYSTEAAHLAALTRAVEAATARAQAVAQERQRVARDELMARRKAKAAKVAKIMRLLEMVDAA
jgi:hypothetical protein